MKQYGIHIMLTPDNPLRRSHLLGDDWSSYRWYDDRRQRDSAYMDLLRRLPNYRDGDAPAQIVTKVERTVT